MRTTQKSRIIQSHHADILYEKWGCPPVALAPFSLVKNFISPLNSSIPSASLKISTPSLITSLKILIAPPIPNLSLAPLKTPLLQLSPAQLKTLSHTLQANRCLLHFPGVHNSRRPHGFYMEVGGGGITTRSSPMNPRLPLHRWRIPPSDHLLVVVTGVQLSRPYISATQRPLQRSMSTPLNPLPSHLC